jgi:hypothetical protein
MSSGRKASKQQSLYLRKLNPDILNKSNNLIGECNREVITLLLRLGGRKKYTSWKYTLLKFSPGIFCYLLGTPENYPQQ